MKQCYCGPKSCPRFVRYIASYKFNAACRIHDWDYSCKTPFSQLQADLRFLEHCIRLSKKNKFWILMAYIAFTVVRLKGHNYYKGNKPC